MKVILVEPLCATPHTETTLELALLHSYAGDEVSYLPLYRYLGSYPWNSPINGNPTLPRDLTSWDHYIHNIIAKHVSILSPEFIFTELPTRVLERLDCSEYSQRSAKTLFSSANGQSDSIDDLAKRSITISRITEFSAKILLTLLSKQTYDIVYVFNGRIPGSWSTGSVAKAEGIKCEFHERGSTINKYALADRPFAYSSSWLQMFSEFRNSRSVEDSRLNAGLFFRRQRTGKLLNFGYNDRFSETEDFDLPGLKDKYVLFLCSSDNEIDTVPNQDSYFSEIPSQYDCVRLLRDVCYEQGVQLIVRIHPGVNEPGNIILSLDDGEKCIVVRPEQQISSYILGKFAYARFSVGSTIGYEFIYMGLSCAFMAKCILYDAPGITLAKDRNSILRYLRNPLVTDSAKLLMNYYGDFFSNYGVDYQLFRPTGQFTGYFDPVIQI
jgi:hypothetical protein